MCVTESSNVIPSGAFRFSIMRRNFNGTNVTIRFGSPTSHHVLSWLFQLRFYQDDLDFVSSPGKLTSYDLHIAFANRDDT